MSDYKFARSQKGSTLIVVLIMLLLITIVGTWAIRGSMTSLNIATNTQAQVLLKQTSDAVFYQLENDTSDDLTLQKMLLGDGILAYLMRTENLGKELVFCIRGENANNWEGARQGSIVYWSDKNTINNSELGINGFCKADNSSDFISSRQAVITRVSVRVASSNEDFAHLTEGQSLPDGKGTDISTIIVNATSLLPSLSNASSSQVNGCISNYTSYVDKILQNKTVMDCLSEFNVPYSSQEMVYTLRAV
ncbi:hypothetical protein G9F32_08565 [Acinetobacter sp. 194]|uniref:PilX N-terminal domain-containing pilus assembly protein n=1 Tax=Acinetobacter shaoyimingii TaxID=2715164 RepID=UPI00140BB8AD|nr:PilX N-terminal domain-containing pilus assembly protein [Acinetobacter shaoyimingii]NHB58074.1 hypothetical protein [Acinetobacter shaoyimingii]